jgi:hypothetical protein
MTFAELCDDRFRVMCDLIEAGVVKKEEFEGLGWVINIIGITALSV